MEIKKVLICGLGAVGLTYASKLKDICELSILANEERVRKYKQNPPIFNGKELNLNYILPTQGKIQDLIIISVKNSGLISAIEFLKDFIGENTIIISLINGISSEKEIAKVYGEGKVLHSYFIGHSAVRNGNKVTQDGIGKIVFGSPYDFNQKKITTLEAFFKNNNIDYETPKDIIYSMWLKYTLNLFSNQSSAILNMNFGEMKYNPKFIEFAKKIIDEIKPIAQKEGVNVDSLDADALKALSMMVDDGKTSMHQDILADRKTEVEIFAGEIIKLGKKYNIPTPINQVMYDMIKILEEKELKIVRQSTHLI